MTFPNSKTRRGRVIDGGNITPTLDTGCEVGIVQIAKDETPISNTISDPQKQRPGVYPIIDDSDLKYDGYRMDESKCNQIGQLYDDESNPQSGRVYSKDGISPTLDAMGGGNRQPKIAVSCASRKRGENHNLEHREDDVANALTGINTDSMVDNGLRIRKLTPRECFRLQGFPDEYFDRAASVCSDTQLYKQAGNSVTVNVIYEIAKRLKI